MTGYTASDIVSIIKETAQAVGVIIVFYTAFKVKMIDHNVNSAATRAQAELRAQSDTIAALTKSLADQQHIAETLARDAGPTKRK